MLSTYSVGGASAIISDGLEYVLLIMAVTHNQKINAWPSGTVVPVAFLS